jgi:hypothetical protein
MRVMQLIIMCASVPKIFPAAWAEIRSSNRNFLLRHPRLFISHRMSRLVGVVVSVLATGPKVAGSNPAEAMDF